LLNLANLELYVGRYERASRSIELLRGRVATMGPGERAQLLGLEAELSARNGDIVNVVDQFEEAARAWDAQSCPLDALELRIEAILAELDNGERSTSGMGDRLAELGRTNGGDLGEHRAAWLIACAKLARAGGDDERARKALDDALELARSGQLREWVWQALDARAALFASQGAAALARRDATEALGTLEEVGARLPRDLREVFWNEPRRRALRESQASTHLPPATSVSDRALTPSRHGHVSYAFPPRAEERLGRLLELTRDLATTHQIDPLLVKVTDYAVALLGAEHGMLLLRDDQGTITTHTSRGRDGSDAHGTFSRSVAEQVMATGEPVVTVSAAKDPRLAEAVSVHQLMIQSIACVPILGPSPGDRTIGALYVETRLREGRMFPQELPILAAFADQAAIAIENARLISENLSRAAALEDANAELAREKAKVAAALERRTEQLVETRRDLRQVRDGIRSHFGYKGLVGTSSAMRRVYAVLERVGTTDVPVLITGESGTGKEVVARAIAATSPRAKKPFVGINCGAIPANLLESELFGHVRGAFTGADRERRGLFREADGGVILLDEIGELPIKMQPGLLRVLQEKVVRPVGASSEGPVDVRVIAATNRDLSAMVAAGTFREDLFYRLNVIELAVPPLRERREDIPLLVDHFLSIFAARYRRDRKLLSRDAIRKLMSYEFPGNVRQLEHLLLSAWLLSDNEEIQAADIDLPASRPRALPAPSMSPDGAARPISKDDYRAAERERMARALEDNGGNRVQAAADAGIPRRTFYRRMREYGLE
jgi:transcriptional regulator with GAF, ATPase, and Fis domain